MVLLFILCGIIAMCVSGIYSCEDKESITCTMLECGGSGFLLKYCSPTNDEFERIVSVDLDRGSSAKSCVENGDAFGTTADNKTIWVSIYCHGNFCVCLETGKDTNASGQQRRNETIMNEALIHSSTNGILNNASYETTDQANDISEVYAEEVYTSTEENLNVTSIQFAFTEDMSGTSQTSGRSTISKVLSRECSATNAFAIKGKHIGPEFKETVYTPTEENLNVTDTSTTVVFTEDISGTSQNSVRSTLGNEVPGRNHPSPNVLAKKNENIDQYFKPMISGGGFILILLIITIMILCRKRKRKVIEPSYQLQAGSGEDLSSSYLVPAELVTESALYVCIPADRSRSLPKNEQRREAKSDISDISETLPKDEHEYFMLVPEVCKFCRPTVPKNDINIYSRIQENGVYDHLVSVPRASISEASTYDHLRSFDIERKGTVGDDMERKTECMESG